MWPTLHQFLSGTRFKAALMAAMLLLGAVSCAVREPDAVAGTWVITEAIVPGQSSLSAEEADAWLGQSFHYGTENLTLGRTSCASAHYEETKTSAAEFKQHYDTELKALNIYDDSIQSISVSCDGQSPMPGQTILLSASGHTYTVWDGVFFKMEKTVPQTQSAVI